MKGDRLTPAERKAIVEGGSTVNVPATVHRAGPTYGGKNTPALINADKQDLAGAASRDASVMVENAVQLSPEYVRTLENSTNTIRQITNADYDNWLSKILKFDD
ncbi:MAG: hypothetical protein P8X74_19225 [Reinekea sp.]